jgi:hypothetical protein
MAKFWDGRDPVGRRFRVPQPGQDPAWITVIGVVGDFRLYDVDVIPSMKAAVFAVDDQTPVEDIQTLSDLRRGRLASPALTAALLGTARASSSCSSASSSASGEPSGSVV